VTGHRERKVKRGNQQDATNSMFIIKLSVSTCFGHHYVHHQENKTVSPCMRCSAWVCRLCVYTPRQNTACSGTRSYSPDDGHNDDRNMLRQSLIINIELVASCWFSLFTLCSCLCLANYKKIAQRLRGVSYRRWRSSIFGILTRLRTGQPRK